MNGYERVNDGEMFYRVDGGNEITGFIAEVDHRLDNELYENANYYSSKEVAENNARADKLLRQLRRFAVENNESKIDWGNYAQDKYYICFDYIADKINKCRVNGGFCTRDLGQIYFLDRNIAEKAVELFGDELIWYFTEYCDHVTESAESAECDEACVFCENEYGLSFMKKREFKYCPECGKRIV